MAGVTRSFQDEIRDECGVFAVWGDDDAVALTHFGLYALQHRGQESAGIAAAGPGNTLVLHRGPGLVSHVFNQEVLERLQKAGGPHALGHVRHTADEDGSFSEAQPLVFRFRGVPIALAQNGGLVDGEKWRHRLERDGAIFQTATDVEIIAHLAARAADPLDQALTTAVNQVKGGYALAALTPHGLFAARDPHGIRPLVLGRLGQAWIVSSETCALDTIGASFVRELAPGERLWIDDRGVRTIERVEAPREAFCAFEYVYFARPDSIFGGQTVHHVRKEMGRRLAREAPATADVVLGVPDSSLPAAVGYGEELGLPTELGLIKNRYAGRVFIRSKHSDRELAHRVKLNPIQEVVAGKSVVVVDDSLVRGTTSRRLVRALRQAGAVEVHLRISSPPFRHPCPYGIDPADRSELMAAQHQIDEIRRLVGADSLHFLSVEAMLEAIGGPPSSFCLGCFTGRYPVEPEAKSVRGESSW